MTRLPASSFAASRSNAAPVSVVTGRESDWITTAPVHELELPPGHAHGPESNPGAPIAIPAAAPLRVMSGSPAMDHPAIAPAGSAGKPADEASPATVRRL